MKFRIILLASFLIFPLIMPGIVYADYDTTYNTYFCNSKDLAIEKSGYSYLVYQEKRYWESQSPKDIATNVLKGESNMMLDDLGKSYHCLKSNGVDPNSVAVIPQYLVDGMNIAKQQDPAKFAELVPNFADYVPVPEFGSLTGIIIVLSIIGLIIISRKINYT